MAPIRYGTPVARWVIGAAVLGSGVAFLDATVVNVALPAIRTDLRMGVVGLQWTLDAYLVTLTSLLLFGGSLGDVIGRRRVFVGGLLGFAVASIACGLSPNAPTLIAARAAQGITGAFLVPGSLAIVSATFHEDDRSRAIGAWSGLAGVTSAIGPFLGGWLIDAVSWRLIFLINIPIIAVAVWMAALRVPETKDEDATSPDIEGAVLGSIALGAITYGLIEGPSRGGAVPVVIAFLGLVGLFVFIAIERRKEEPLLPFEIFRSQQFTGANLTTLAVYAALGGTFFLLVLQLEISLRYSALAAGAALMPVTILMLLLSSRAGALAQRVGPRWPMTLGPIVAGVGLLLFTRVRPQATYVSAVLPGVLVFGLGLTLTVAPLTAAVLAAVGEHHVGVGSGVNNAVARLGGLIAVAVLPVVAGIGRATPGALDRGFVSSMRICAAACAAGGVVAFFTVREKRAVTAVPQASMIHPCGDPCLAEAS